MTYTGVVLILLALCGIACGENPSSKSPASTGINNGTAHSAGPNGTSKPQTKSTAAPSKTPNVTLAPNTTATPGNSTAAPGNSTAAPGNSTAAPGNSTAAPGNSTAAPGNSTAAPRNSTTRPTTVTKVPSSKPGNHSSNPNVTPTPKGHGGKKSDRGKWVATGFAIVFFLTTVIMTVLYCRQRRIYRELEGDSSLSRLI
ncbi:mucin-7-like [Pocillopora damicornis]|uniref:mucin-7-like n=1 Tax=Pocillopora damicornis TaxID=46731 RepID=UPI000F556253|nr:mucin-7-like [Pocillopora damicornis]